MYSSLMDFDSDDDNDQFDLDDLVDAFDNLHFDNSGYDGAHGWDEDDFHSINSDYWVDDIIRATLDDITDLVVKNSSTSDHYRKNPFLYEPSFGSPYDAYFICEPRPLPPRRHSFSASSSLQLFPHFPRHPSHPPGPFFLCRQPGYLLMDDMILLPSFAEPWYSLRLNIDQRFPSFFESVDDHFDAILTAQLDIECQLKQAQRQLFRRNKRSINQQLKQQLASEATSNKRRRSQERRQLKRAKVRHSNAH